MDRVESGGPMWNFVVFIVHDDKIENVKRIDRVDRLFSKRWREIPSLSTVGKMAG